MTRLILVRHGQSEANLKRIGAGQLDVELTELGMTQAALTAKYILSTEKVDKIFSSDLKRAYHTALPLADALGMTVETSKELREINTGVWSGLTVDEQQEKYPELYRQFHKDRSLVRFPNGEYMPEVYDRVVGCICHICKENSDATVVVVSHAGSIRIFNAFAEGYSRLESGKASICHNAAINIYDCDGTVATPIKINITEHLNEYFVSNPYL